jgi:DNA replication factor GINS
MITFETLRKILQEETDNKKLSQLPENFFEEVREYLGNKEELSRERGKYEFQTARMRFSSIVEARERKLLGFALSYARSGAFPEHMLPEERELVEKVAALIRDFRERRDSRMSKKSQAFSVVAFIEELPQFVGIDLSIYGPYRKGDIASIPEENARLLAEKGAAEIIEGKPK